MPVIIIKEPSTGKIEYEGGYSYPDGPFWDENGYIPAAQKYINGVFFMSDHPPLGKLIMSLGEVLINPNENIDTSSFLTTDFIHTFPDNYSFAGMRFFPVLFGALSSVLFFLILSRLSVSIHYAFAFTSLYLFDNALLVHFRGAMIDGIQIFFILLSILYFLIIVQKRGIRSPMEYFILGSLIGSAISVKFNGAILLLLFIFLAFEDFRPIIMKLRFTWKSTIDFFTKAVLSASGVLLVFFISYYIHFSVASHVEGNRLYFASAQYQSILKSKTTANPVHFFMMLRDSFAYIENYEKGVPQWDPAKINENGSPPYAWPFGYKSINYRWSKSGGSVAYLYLQGNPLIWFSGLFGIFMATIFVSGVFLFKTPAEDRMDFRMIFYFTVLYFAYMGLMLTIKRVMYLYHYFIPLLFSLILAFMIFQHFFRKEMKTNDRILRNISIIFFIEIFCVFLFFSPLSYFIPMDSISFIKRSWFKVWGLVPVNL